VAEGRPREVIMCAMPPADPGPTDYRPTLPPEHLDQIRIWHDRAYAEALEEGSEVRSFDYLGVSIIVPPDVMPITPMSHLLGEQVLSKVGPGDRVLDMGTGSGVNAVLAATRGASVLAVDISAPALEAARANVARNGVPELVEVKRSDVFSDVRGEFDWIVFDPPFRWFKPRSIMESVMADEGYQAMTRFFREARSHLEPEAKMLIFFGTSGDLGYLHRLMAEEGFRWQSLAHDDVVRDGWKVDYFTFLVS
jgi:release factor glutamine methyltransferase